MKTTITKTPEKFEPVTVSFTFETLEEFTDFKFFVRYYSWEEWNKLLNKQSETFPFNSELHIKLTEL